MSSFPFLILHPYPSPSTTTFNIIHSYHLHPFSFFPFLKSSTPFLILYSSPPLSPPTSIIHSYHLSPLSQSHSFNTSLSFTYVRFLHSAPFSYNSLFYYPFSIFLLSSHIPNPVPGHSNTHPTIPHHPLPSPLPLFHYLPPICQTPPSFPFLPPLTLFCYLLLLGQTYPSSFLPLSSLSLYLPLLTTLSYHPP